jgi:queuine tRNA-ribosyltransferase
VLDKGTGDSHPPQRPGLGEYEIHTAREGFASIAHRPSGQIMHSRTPPMEEAQRVYVEQADLGMHLRLPASEGEVVLWDVGLGGAANAMAAIRCYEEHSSRGPVRPLRIVSFENDLDSLRLAFAHRERFPYLLHDGPEAILRDGHWQAAEYAGLSWELVEGDFLETMRQAPGPPEVIFYDMFSGGTSGGVWGHEAFRRIFAACGGRSAELCTYTLSTACRVAMLAAGFFVARGRPAGGKQETTIALTPKAAATEWGRRHELLGAEWLGKWHRSRAKFPAGLPKEEQPAMERTILSHAQFRHLQIAES